MKVRAVIKSHRPYAHMRLGLVENCVISAVRAFEEVVLYGNGLQDGSEGELRMIAEEHGAEFQRVSAEMPTSHCTPGHGAQRVGDLMVARSDPDDIIVLSDDDMVWKPCAGGVLAEAWSFASEGRRFDEATDAQHLTLLCGFLEPNFAWSRPITTHRLGPHWALLRESVPGAAWTFPAAYWRSRIREHIRPKFGYDFDASTALRAAKRSLGTLDLAEHAGWEHSTHGNRADKETGARPIDKKRWLLKDY